MPKATWGTQISRLGLKRIESLTAAAKNAVGLGHAGASPYVCLAVVVDEATHPAFVTHRNRIQAFWRWLRSHDRDKHDLGLLWQAYQFREVDGPVSLLGESLGACDLDLDEHLQLLADHGTLDLSTAPWRAVYLLIVRGFHKAEGRNLAHRRILGQVGLINVDLFRSGLKGLSEEHQGLVRVAATGARFEHAEIARFSDKFDEMCRLCGELDTRSHRLTSCPATEHVRERHREVLEKWDSFPEPLKLHLLPSEAPFRGEFLRRLGSVPPPDIVRRPPGPKTIWFTNARECVLTPTLVRSPAASKGFYQGSCKVLIEARYLPS